MRVAGYIRVSTEEQAREGFSLDVQRQRIESYCQSRGWTLIGIWQDDSTGRDTNRPGYQAMMAAKDSWDAVLVIKLDRIHRRQKNFIEMIEQLISWGKSFVSISDNIDLSSAMGRFVVDLMARIAELESDQISERTLPAMDVAKERGFHVGAPPLGFKWDDETKKFVPTAWGTEIYNFAKVHGVKAASEKFKYEDKDSKKAGKPVSVTAIKRILRNFRLYEKGSLTPNRERTKMGTHSKVLRRVGPSIEV